MILLCIACITGGGGVYFNHSQIIKRLNIMKEHLCADLKIEKRKAYQWKSRTESPRRCPRCSAVIKK